MHGRTNSRIVPKGQTAPEASYLKLWIRPRPNFSEGSVTNSLTRLPQPPATNTPNLVQILRWVMDPLSLLEGHRDRLGDLFYINRNGIIAGHPDYIREIFERDGQELSSPGTFNALLQPLLGDQSVLLLSGDHHRRRRKLLMPPFHGKALQSYGTTIQAIAQEVLHQFQPGQKIIARNAAQTLTLRVIMETVFGLRGGDHYDAMAPLLTQMVDMTATPAKSMFLFFRFLQQSWGPWGKFERSREQLDRLVYQELADRRAAERNGNSGDHADIFSLLLAARDEDGNPMTDQELRDELMTLLFAGHETTATAIAWAMYWIHANPQCLRKLRAELDTLPDGTPPMELLKQPYLMAVCKESLRIYPVAIALFPRFVEASFVMGGHYIPAGQAVMGSAYLVHHRQDLYPDSKTFRPDRFLKRQFTATEFIPFGGGSRRCIGSALAMAELAISISTWVKYGEFELKESGPIKPERRGVTLGPKGGVKLRFLGLR